MQLSDMTKWAGKRGPWDDIPGHVFTKDGEKYGDEEWLGLALMALDEARCVNENDFWKIAEILWECRP